MHQFPPPFPPLTTTTTTTHHHHHHHPASDTSSPPSSRTTSPPASPTSTLRRRHQPTQLSPHHLFNLSFQCHPSTSTAVTTSIPNPKGDLHLDTDTISRPEHNNSPGHNATTAQSVSILPCAVLRGRSSLMIVRRRPSAVDMALSEERCRCDEDAIERQGLDLMEPRPVDTTTTTLPMSLLCVGLQMDLGQRDPGSRASGGSDTRSVAVQQPRFVMGGIFEVMEGRA